MHHAAASSYVIDVMDKGARALSGARVCGEKCGISAIAPPNAFFYILFKKRKKIHKKK
jgi:hypothetical protein